MKILKPFFIAFIETLILFGISRLFHIAFMEIFFLGALAILGAYWIFSLNAVRQGNIINATNKGQFGLGDGTVTTFKMRGNAFLIGSAGLTITSFIVTVITYIKYFV